MNVLDFDQHLPALDCHRVLRAYAAALDAASTPETEPDDDPNAPQAASRWIPRLREIPGVDPARLAPIHGRLIAMGLLQFQLLGRSEGVVYQLTPQGRRILESPGEETLQLRPCG